MGNEAPRASGLHPPPRRWIERIADLQVIRRLSKELHVGLVTARALANRGIATPDEAAEFLYPRLTWLHDPFALASMHDAVARLADAVRARERVLVYGDFDVDGLAATAMLGRFLGALGVPVSTYVPDRLEEGYGVHGAAIEEAARAGFRLVITCDCGISSFAEVATARRLGMDVIVTDHHAPVGGLPPATAVLNPNRPDCPYPFKHLAGAGVAYKLAEASAYRLGLNVDQFHRAFIDLVALGTVADVVPVLGENRVFVKHGLEALRHTKKTGLRALLREVGLENRPLSTYSVGFVLAPRLNAAGRMGTKSEVQSSKFEAGGTLNSELRTQNSALTLLLTDDGRVAAAIARDLDRANAERQSVEAAILEEAIEWVEQQADPDADRVLIAHGADWHPGVVGIVAARIRERYGRPAILLALDGDEARGSGRSVPGFDLVAALGAVEDLLTRYGGHAMAAGLTLPAELIEAFRRRLNEHARSLLHVEDLVPQLTVDQALRLEEIDLGLINELTRLAPWGVGNPRPLFTASGVRVAQARRVGSGGAHLKLVVEQDGVPLEAIAFRRGELLDKLRRDRPVEICFGLEANEWNGVIAPQLVVEDIRMETSGQWSVSSGQSGTKN